MARDKRKSGQRQPGRRAGKGAGATQAQLRVQKAPLYSLSFMDGYLMACTVLGHGRDEALALWRGHLGEAFGGLEGEYLAAKQDSHEAIYFTEDFLGSAPQMESWVAGLAVVLRRDAAFGERVTALGKSEEGMIVGDFMCILEGAVYAGPLQVPTSEQTEPREIAAFLNSRWARFQAELRGLGGRRRLEYAGGLLGLVQGLVEGKIKPD